MDANELKTRIRDGSLGGVYIFGGEEEYLKRYYLAQLREKIVPDETFAPFNHVVFDGPEVDFGALALLSEINARHENDLISYDAEDPSRAFRVKWTKQDDCPMFYQARQLISKKFRNECHKEDVLSRCSCISTFLGSLTGSHRAGLQSFKERHSGFSDLRGSRST